MAGRAGIFFLCWLGKPPELKITLVSILPFFSLYSRAYRFCQLVDKHKSATKVAVCLQQLAVWMKQTARFIAGKKTLPAPTKTARKAQNLTQISQQLPPPSYSPASGWLPPRGKRGGGAAFRQPMQVQERGKEEGRGGRGRCKGKRGFEDAPPPPPSLAAVLSL